MSAKVKKKEVQKEVEIKNIEDLNKLGVEGLKAFLWGRGAQRA